MSQAPLRVFHQSSPEKEIMRPKDESPSKPLMNTPTVVRKKYEMCKNWKEKGSCRYGDKCLFAHGEMELSRKKSDTPNESKEGSAASTPVTEVTKDHEIPEVSAFSLVGVASDSDKENQKSDKEEPLRAQEELKEPEHPAPVPRELLDYSE